MNHRVFAVILIVSLLSPMLMLASPRSGIQVRALSQMSGTVNVDNTPSNGAATGSILDQANRPIAVVEIENNHSFWLRVMDRPPTNEVEILYDYPATNKWAEWGYIPPYGTATYAIRFDPDNDSYLDFLVNGAASVDGSIPAGLWTATERAFDTAVIILGGSGAFQDATIAMLVKFTEIMADLPDCVDAFELPLDNGVLNLANFSINFTQCLSSNEYAEALVELLSVYGAQTSVEEIVRTVLTRFSIADLFNDVFDTYYAILAGEYAGGIQFSSLIGIEGSGGSSEIPTAAASVASASPVSDLASLSGEEIRDRVESAVAAAGTFRFETWEIREERYLTQSGEIDIGHASRIDSVGGGLASTSYCRDGVTYFYSFESATWASTSDGGPCKAWILDDILNWLWDDDWTFAGAELDASSGLVVLEWDTTYPNGVVLRYWIDPMTYLPVRSLSYIPPNPGTGEHEIETLFTAWGDPVNIDLPPEALLPTPTPIPTLADRVSKIDPNTLLDAISSADFPSEWLPAGFEYAGSPDVTNDPEIADIGSVEFEIYTAAGSSDDDDSFSFSPSNQFAIAYAVLDSSEVAANVFWDLSDQARREGTNVWSPSTFAEPAGVVSAVEDNSLAVCMVQVGNVLVLGYSFLNGRNIGAAETNAIDLAWAARSFLESIVSELENNPDLIGILPPEGVATYDYTGGDHTEGSVEYEQSPPVGGPHDPIWQTCQYYDGIVRNENAVHSLEHGAVWLTYRPDISLEDKEKLMNLAEGDDYLIVSEYPGQESPIVATAWNNQLPIASIASPELTQFIAYFREGPQTPEPGATCQGGLVEVRIDSATPGSGFIVADGIVEIVISSTDIAFDPYEVTVPVSYVLSIDLPNTGTVMHNFTVDELGVNIDINPGETEVVGFTNVPPGEYEFYCNVPGHREAGMVGTITVTE